MDDEERPPAYHDNTIATLYRLDPDKLKAIRRAVTGMTRCPECDELNRADEKWCSKCGAKLYPDLDYEAEKPQEGEPEEEPKKESRRRDEEEPQPDY